MRFANAAGPMILMALDRVRDYVGTADNPTDFSKASAALFFTRWITHCCAPTFFLLTGTGAYLSRRSKSKSELSRFLLTRGQWLIFLEIVVVRAISIVMILTHNMFDSVRSTLFGTFAPVWTILHAPDVVYADKEPVVFAAHVLIPWIGVTAVGFGLGQVFAWPAGRRKNFLLKVGRALTIAFVALRALNVYGNPVRWSAQRSPFFTALSFLNTNKYPPSLLFLLMTLGPALLVLRAVDGRTPDVLQPALTFGKVPLFYYVLHLTLIHLIALGIY